MRVKLIAAACAALAIPAAAAQTDDCQSTYGQRACAAPALAPLRAELAQKYAALLALGNRTATWQARHTQALQAIRAARDYDGAPLDDTALAQQFRDVIADYDRALAQAEQVRMMIKTPSARSATCMATWLDQGCRVSASGILRDAAGRTVHWQMLAGASAADGVGAGILLWAETGHGTARLIGWSFDGVFYEPPRITQAGLIWVPGRIAGTGDGNADLLFAWDDAAARWNDIDLDSWRETLPAKLPRGFGIWKGVDYDFEGMGATSKLWRDQDANCCPSGGEAQLEFTIAGRRLVLRQVDVAIVEKWAPRRRD
ncbi:uncharacterized protein J2Y54_002856 [Sphingomonas sp. BE123]|uniref:hypothetical protein n=1 Tax=Sphingomonas sp. BE123 TaxID=2817842 RepID=UPI00285C08C4|nr:hypothetical protein [Sphingomonas sp. BE123]MDR6853336.1 uncharacterized protein [Sphingomonas sp. BE123]